MDHYQSIASHFQGSIEAAAMAVDELAAPLAQAADLVTRALLEDHKVIACGVGADAALAQLFVSHMQYGPGRERPPLPAINLASEGAALNDPATAPGQDIFAPRIRALGQAGDVLLIINSASDGSPLCGALNAAAERNMAAVILSNGDDLALPAAAGDNCALLQPAASGRSHILELQVKALHCLCQLIENQLFGDQDGNH
jgi:phosphoheptose isomerase